MSASAIWDKALGDAKKALGSSGKINDKKMQGAIQAGLDAKKVWDSFNTMAQALKKKLLDLQNAESKAKNTLAQADDEITDDDYGLDPKKPEDKKKIDQAQAIFKKFFKDTEKMFDDNVSNLRELDKHLTNIDNYKRAG